MAERKRARPPLRISDLTNPAEEAGRALASHSHESVYSVLRRLCAQSGHLEPTQKLRRLAILLNIPDCYREDLTRRQLCVAIAAHLRRYGEDVDPDAVAQLVHADTHDLPEPALQLIGEFAGSPTAVDVITRGQLGREVYLRHEGARREARRLAQGVSDSVARSCRASVARAVSSRALDSVQVLQALYDQFGNYALREIANAVIADPAIIDSWNMYDWSLRFADNPLTAALVRLARRYSGRRAPEDAGRVFPFVWYRELSEYANTWPRRNIRDWVRQGHVGILRELVPQLDRRFAEDVLHTYLQEGWRLLPAEVLEAVAGRITLPRAKAAARVLRDRGEDQLVAQLCRAWPGEGGVKSYLERLGRVRGYPLDFTQQLIRREEGSEEGSDEHGDDGHDHEFDRGEDEYVWDEDEDEPYDDERQGRGPGAGAGAGGAGSS
jgi:hypothetical protein